MKAYTPYTYLIGWTNHNKWYYGVRYARGCHPDDLWVKYFTSSSYVKNFIKNNGNPDVIEIRKTFQDARSAMLWEEKVLNKLNVVYEEKWINKTCGPVKNVLTPEENSKLQKELWRRPEMISKMKKMRSQPEYKEMMSKVQTIAQNSPNVKEKKSKYSKSIWADPIQRQKRMETYSSPEYRKKRSELAFKQHEKRRLENPPVEKIKKDKSIIVRNKQNELLSLGIHNFQNELNRKKSTESVRKSNKNRIGYKWWNNGIKNKQSMEYPGDGWNPGRVKKEKL